MSPTFGGGDLLLVLILLTALTANYCHERGNR